MQDPENTRNTACNGFLTEIGKSEAVYEPNNNKNVPQKNTNDRTVLHIGKVLMIYLSHDGSTLQK